MPKIYKYTLSCTNTSITIKEVEAEEKGNYLFLLDPTEVTKINIADLDQPQFYEKEMYSLSNDKVEEFKKIMIAKCHNLIAACIDVIAVAKEEIKNITNASVRNK